MLRRTPEGGQACCIVASTATTWPSSRWAEGAPLVCVHGSPCDFRVWSCVLGPLSRRHRVIALSLRHFFPEHWDGVGSGYTIAQHVADVIGFIEALGEGTVEAFARRAHRVPRGAAAAGPGAPGRAGRAWR